MLKFIGHDIWRGGEKVGWVEEHHVFARDGRKLGYFDAKYVYGEDGRRLAYIEGDHLVPYGGSSAKVPLEKISEEIEGGVLPEIGKCAVYVLLGD